jgi:hypothetical protein
MPYVIRPRWALPSAVAACSALLSFGSSAAQAATTAVNTSSCSAPALSQPFAAQSDSNYYMLAPGQAQGQFNGAGWTLSGGAAVVSAPLPAGGYGKVLNLPAGAKAVSPAICVTTAYPWARMRVHHVFGYDAVNFAVGYAGRPTWESPKSEGEVLGALYGWTLSEPLSMSPEHVEGWQLVQITLTGSGHWGDAQVDDLYIDPYSR